MRLLMGIAATVGLVAACGSSAPATPQFLYIAADVAGGMVSKYTLPLTATSAPTLQFASAFSVEMAQDSTGSLLVSDKNGLISYFTAPITAASTPSATFHNGVSTSVGQMALATNGDLYVSTASGVINVFTPPFADTTVPSSSITETAVINATGVGFDSSENLYLSGYATTGGQLAAIAAPYTGTPVAPTPISTSSYRKLAVAGDKLFIASATSASPRIDVYSLPLSAASAQDFSISTDGSPETVSIDGEGNLYVGCAATATVEMFAPPFSATSVAATTLLVGDPTTTAIFGILVAQ